MEKEYEAEFQDYEAENEESVASDSELLQLGCGKRDRKMKSLSDDESSHMPEKVIF